MKGYVLLTPLLFFAAPAFGIAELKLEDLVTQRLGIASAEKKSGSTSTNNETNNVPRFWDDWTINDPKCGGRCRISSDFASSCVPKDDENVCHPTDVKCCTDLANELALDMLLSI